MSGEDDQERDGARADAESASEASAGPAEPRRKAKRGAQGGRQVARAVRLSAAEDAALQLRATSARLSVGGYMRARLVGEAGPGTRGAPGRQTEVIAQAVAAVLATRGDLNRVGNNLNQIARTLNQGGVPDRCELSAALEAFRQASRAAADAYAALVAASGRGRGLP